MSSPDGKQTSDAGPAQSEGMTGNAEKALIDEKLTGDRLRQEIKRLQAYAGSLEEALAEKTRNLAEVGVIAESATLAKSMFLANMSHELRTPLNAILGFSEALVAGIFGELNPKHKEYINEIYKSGMSLLALINEVLDLSRIESGLTELDYSESSVREIVAGCVYVFREKAKKHNIELVVTVEEETGLFDVDVRKVKQVFVNILSYIFGYTPDGGTIQIRGRQVIDPPDGTGYAQRLSGEFIEISVEDSGPEIGPEEKKRLFEPFAYREDLQYRKYDGPALSLVICRKIAEIHKGRIWVESVASGVEGGGRNRFIFMLPRYSREKAVVGH